MKSYAPPLIPLLRSKSHVNRSEKVIEASRAALLAPNRPSALALARFTSSVSLLAEEPLSRTTGAFPVSVSFVKKSRYGPGWRFATAVVSLVEVASPIRAVRTSEYNSPTVSDLADPSTPALRVVKSMSTFTVIGSMNLAPHPLPAAWKPAMTFAASC